MSTGPRVVSVQVGPSRTHQWLGREVRTSIDKHPVTGPVPVEGVNLAGDAQSDPVHHGGADRVVYAYARADAQWWEAELDRPLPGGAFGENLTTAGVDLNAAVIGQTWQVGTAVLQVSEPRTPCWKLGLKMGDAKFPRRFAAARRPGLFLRVLAAGALQAGDAIEPGPAPAHGVTIDSVNRIYYGDDRDLSPLYAAVELSGHWREWASHRTVWHVSDDS